MGVEGCDGDRVVVNVERGIGSFVIDGRVVTRFVIALKPSGRGAVVCGGWGGQTACLYRHWWARGKSAFLGDKIRSISVNMEEGDRPLACAVADV